ncbi:MAG: histidine triad nucleotide-binding protein [Oscillospiraceae bacterium]|nr:histidine triad nucleotide-binding protein [Oscillospiraceae bacterium]
MKDCLFCKIVKGEIPSERVYEDDDILAFKDIAPAAHVHILIIPKLHIDGADALSHDEPKHAEIAGNLIMTAGKLAHELGLKDGWRIVTNVLTHGGQTVRHLHFHLLGGEQLGDFGSKLLF